MGFMFQSSPALKDRCNALSDLFVGRMGWVSILTGLERPVQLTDILKVNEVIAVSILTGLERPVQLASFTVVFGGKKKFQSSPALKDRCNKLPAYINWRVDWVSILTGLERPVQP